MIDPKDLVEGATVTLAPLKVIAHTGDLILVEKNGYPSQWCTWDASKLAQLAVSVTPPPPPPPPPEPDVGDVWRWHDKRVDILAAQDRNGMVPVRMLRSGLYTIAPRSSLTLVTRAADRAAADGDVPHGRRHAGRAPCDG